MDLEKSVQRCIEVREGKFTYLKRRLVGGEVFVSRNQELYLRTGVDFEIQKEMNVTRNLFRRGFPVPEIIAEGHLKDKTAYYIEKSIGTDVFGEIFREETKKNGHASEASFDAFVAVVEKYARAQCHQKNLVLRNPILRQSRKL